MSQHNSVTTQHCHNTTVSQHNNVTTQQCHNTTVSQHNTVTTQKCHNSKAVIFQEELLKVLKCYNFLWVQWRHICSPGTSFANCVTTPYQLKVHVQMFLSTPINQKFQIMSCYTLVAIPNRIEYTRWKSRTNVNADFGIWKNVVRCSKCSNTGWFKYDRDWFFFVTIIAHHSSNSQTGLNRF